MTEQPLYIRGGVRQPPSGKVQGEFVDLLGEQFYQIRNFDRMPPFFINIVTSSDQWMFISSSGGLTAGRSSAEMSLFPYWTDDQVSENAGNTGHVAVFRVTRGRHSYLWEPFSDRFAGLYHVERSLFKNGYGDKLIFEEINSDLGLRYRYAWRTSDRYGFVKTSWLVNLGRRSCRVSLLDGLQNLLPPGATTAIQNTFSNLLNAYKRNELDPETGLGIFSLSATMSDRAEPSEALRATIAWQTGLTADIHLLCSDQVDAFRSGLEIGQEMDIRGRRGAYLVCAQLDLAAGGEKEWSIIADVNQDHSAIASLLHFLKQEHCQVIVDLTKDIARGSENLRTLIASADGLQVSGDHMITEHHLTNVLFNILRGGIFVDQYREGKNDFLDFIRVRNLNLPRKSADFFESLPAEFTSQELLQKAADSGLSDLERLSYEYLPLTFGRRHGDPSRPWNRFSIHLRKQDGSKMLDYQGNWRDLFQNWEPLAWSYPGFAESMICKFLNATTADGYNPYRVTREGIEWEVPAPLDPWANIGYWSDHQLIYIEKLLEISRCFHPGWLQGFLTRKIFSHANVPYRLRKYADILNDWYETIEYDRDLEHVIAGRVRDRGTDGKLVWTAAGEIFHVTMAEKLLILLLAKLGNFVPEGGIWMNTQRPEWNDANNALVGKGLSVVTTCYLRRYVIFFRNLLAESDIASFSISTETKLFLETVHAVLKGHRKWLAGSFSDEHRRVVMDELGEASSNYRWSYYANSLSGEFSDTSKEAILEFLDLVGSYVDHTLKSNERPDHLYHAYNILHLKGDEVSVGRLYEMLEGQVAILSSGLLSCSQSLGLLHSLRKSGMYCSDQHSYMLYPDRNLPGFLEKNQISSDQVQDLTLVTELSKAGDHSLISCDINGTYHFNSDFRNATDVRNALNSLRQNPILAGLVDAEERKILDLFEAVFDHKSFTGRSGTFFAYEGLGSIYWHMVSKLLLAIQETVLHAHETGEAHSICRELEEIYFDVRKGLGFNKLPGLYGAFPTDPYSHTPAGQGAKQPGMTGQVKEEILVRFVELGLRVDRGVIFFDPFLLQKGEYLQSAGSFDYVDIRGQNQSFPLPVGALAYTFCQTPIMYQSAQEAKTEILFSDGSLQTSSGRELTFEVSQHIFNRDGWVKKIVVSHRHELLDH